MVLRWDADHVVNSLPAEDFRGSVKRKSVDSGARVPNTWRDLTAFRGLHQVVRVHPPKPRPILANTC